MNAFQLKSHVSDMRISIINTKTIGDSLSFWGQACEKVASIQHLKEEKDNNTCGWFAWDICYSAFQSIIIYRVEVRVAVMVN